MNTSHYAPGIHKYIREKTKKKKKRTYGLFEEERSNVVYNANAHSVASGHNRRWRILAFCLVGWRYP